MASLEAWKTVPHHEEKMGANEALMPSSKPNIAFRALSAVERVIRRRGRRQ
jgi:hypothetical protein